MSSLKLLQDVTLATSYVQKEIKHDYR